MNIWIGLIGAIGCALTWQYANPDWTVVYLICFLLITIAFYEVQLSDLITWLRVPSETPFKARLGRWNTVAQLSPRLGLIDKTSELNTQNELAKLRGAVNELPDILFIMDRYFYVSWCNAKAIEMFGPQTVARPIFHYVRSPEFMMFLENADRAESLKMSFGASPGPTHEAILIEPNQDFRLLVLRDITASERVDAVRRDFVANVSHEIRTPLTVIAGFAETMIDQHLSRETSEQYLNLMLRHANTMRQLVDDLLTLSKLESGAALSNHAVVDLLPLLESQIGDAKTISDNRHLFMLQAPQDIKIHAYASEIETVIRNLLVNAIRYTPSGGTITVGLDHDENGVRIQVKDTGIGIKPEHIERITERFYRVDKSRSRENGGTGLGLAIVKHIALRHNAKLEISSQLGVGSVFSLVFPVDRYIPSSN